MAIKITEDGNVIYENEPTVERELLPNITDGEQYAKQAEEALERIEEIAESIPEDYSQLSEDVAELKIDLNQKADKTDALSAYIVETETGSIASFSDGADDVPVKDLTVAIEPVQGGSGDPSPENVRPISGWTGAIVTACGVNIFNPDPSTYETFDLTGEGVYRYGHSYPSGTYTIINNTDHEMYYRLPTKDLSNRGATIVINSTVTANVTVDADHIMWAFASGSSYDTTNFMVALGTETVFKAFQGETYEVDWTTEAGTVYGGTLDVTTGVLTVDRAYYTTTLSTKNLLAEGAYDQYVFYSRLTGGYPFSAIEADTSIRPICNIAPYWYSNLQTSLHFYSSRDTFQVFVPSGTPETTVVEVMYFITQPQTYQLTPQEVATVLGQNNIFADTGNVTVQYRADTKLYIDKVLNA